MWSSLWGRICSDLSSKSGSWRITLFCIIKILRAELLVLEPYALIGGKKYRLRVPCRSECRNLVTVWRRRKDGETFHKTYFLHLFSLQSSKLVRNIRCFVFCWRREMRTEKEMEKKWIEENGKWWNSYVDHCVQGLNVSDLKSHLYSLRIYLCIHTYETTA